MATAADARAGEGLAHHHAALPRSRTLAEWLYIPFCALSLLPFLLVQQPPITDFANHVARLWIACNAADPAVAAMYQYRLGIIPNLAVDLVNAPLCGLATPDGIVRGVTVGALVLIYLSGWLIQKKLWGRPNVFLLGLPALAFNLVTTMGYVNYLAGAGFVCLLVALTLGEQRPARTMLLGNVLGVVIFFCHIFALAGALLFFLGRFLGEGRPTITKVLGAGLRTGLMFAAPLLLMPFVAGQGTGLDFNYDSKLRLLAALFMTQHAGLNFNGLLLLFPLFWFMAKGRLALHPAFRWPLAILGLFVLLAPSALQQAVDVDARSAVLLAYLFFAALFPVRPFPAMERAMALVAGLLIALHLVLASTIWVRFDQGVLEVRQATAGLPRESLLLTVATEERLPSVAAPLAYSHLASYATIDRQVFNPLEFTGLGMQPMSARPPFLEADTPNYGALSVDIAERMKRPEPEFAERARLANAGFALRWPERFDYVLFYHHGGPSNFDPRLLTEVRRGSFFSILKVNRPGRTPRRVLAPHS